MAKQESFEGMKPLEIPELNKLAHEYADLRDRRMELLKQEVELKELVLAKMHEHKLAAYEDAEQQLTITIKTDEKIKVKIKGAEPEEENDGADGD